MKAGGGGGEWVGWSTLLPHTAMRLSVGGVWPSGTSHWLHERWGESRCRKHFKRQKELLLLQTRNTSVAAVAAMAATTYSQFYAFQKSRQTRRNQKNQTENPRPTASTHTERQCSRTLIFLTPTHSMARRRRALLAALYNPVWTWSCRSLASEQTTGHHLEKGRRGGRATACCDLAVRLLSWAASNDDNQLQQKHLHMLGCSGEPNTPPARVEEPFMSHGFAMCMNGGGAPCIKTGTCVQESHALTIPTDLHIKVDSCIDFWCRSTPDLITRWGGRSGPRGRVISRSYFGFPIGLCNGLHGKGWHGKTENTHFLTCTQ